jgi:hypothetical protein
MKIRNAKKYRFPDSFILIIGNIIAYFHLPYRQTEGIIKATLGKSLLPIDKKPSYSQICRRTNKLDIGINGGIDNDFVIITIDKISCVIVVKQLWEY